MRIGIDASCWGNNRGYGRFTRELLGAILEVDTRCEYLFFVDSCAAATAPMPPQARMIVADTSVPAIEAASANGRRSLRDIWAMTNQVLKHKIDLFFFPSVYSYFPIVNRTKIVVTIHDMIADYHPELIFSSPRSRFFWKLKQNGAVRQADVIATVSNHSKQQIIEYFNLPESRLRIISEAARPVFKILPLNNGNGAALSRYGLRPDEEFLLYVGGISPHKNLAALIRAFSPISKNRRFENLKLVLVGDYRNDPFFSSYPELRSLISAVALESKVIFTGFVPDDDLVYLYNKARLLVFPSIEEGFGLPAIEAMACGTPVAASNTGSLPEVLAEAGRFFDPSDPGHIRRVIEEILSDDGLREEMGKNGLARSKQFHWHKAAQDALAIFNELAG